jgi:acyl carrier protein
VTKDEIREVVFRVLGRIAPEADLKAIDHHASMRDQLDIDSVDFLNFAVGLNKELGVDIPDADLPKLASLDGCVSYLLLRIDGSDSY